MDPPSREGSLGVQNLLIPAASEHFFLSSCLPAFNFPARCASCSGGMLLSKVLETCS
jgi:hypothetical protein